MKATNVGLIASLLVTCSASALNPPTGWYGGLGLGVSQAPDIQFNLGSTPGTLTHTVLGKTGGQIGYRKNHFRVEGEVFYNNNAYSHLTIGDRTFPNSNSNASTSNSFRENSNSDPSLIAFNGYTNTYALMLNGFFDFYSPGETKGLVPYVGLGVGYAHVENNLNFVSSSSSANIANVYEATNDMAGQVIAGLSYYLTDSFSFSLDGRYFSSLQSNNTLKPVLPLFQAAPQIQGRSQIYSVNLLFNAAFFGA